MDALRPGYKLTDVGVIPEEWSVVAVGTAGEVVGGRQRSPSAVGRPCKYLRVANVFDDYIDTSDVFSMPFTDREVERFRLRPGDILLNEGQSLELVGRSAIYRGDPPDCCFQNTLVRFRANPGTCAEFAQLIFRKYLESGVFASIALQTTSIAHLGTGRFTRLALPLPPLKEQQAIASMTADADALIAAVDRLAAKKRAMTRAAMQQLLTGRTRLPGFTGEWATRRLGELAEVVSGGTPSTGSPMYWGGSIRWCTPTDLTACADKYLTVTERTITPLGMASCSARMLPPGTLLLCSRATVGELRIAGVDVCTNQGFKSLICNSESSSEFLYYKLLTMKPQLLERAYGSTFLEVPTGAVVNLPVVLPNLPEQQAIAAVLSDMDAEVRAVEAERDKAWHVKRGMMQELLTGRTRLV